MHNAQCTIDVSACADGFKFVEVVEERTAKGVRGALAYFVSRQSPPEKGARLALTLSLAFSVSKYKSLYIKR